MRYHLSWFSRAVFTFFPGLGLGFYLAEKSEDGKLTGFGTFSVAICAIITTLLYWLVFRYIGDPHSLLAAAAGLPMLMNGCLAFMFVIALVFDPRMKLLETS